MGGLRSRGFQLQIEWITTVLCVELSSIEHGGTGTFSDFNCWFRGVPAQIFQKVETICIFNFMVRLKFSKVNIKIWLPGHSTILA